LNPEALTEPIAKAIYMMFLSSEVHPFNDGNGRIARIMMNAELVKGNQTRIIVPTVFREDYILSLRKLSRDKDPSVLIRVMERLQMFSDNLYGDDFDELNEYLKKCDAFEEPERGKPGCLPTTLDNLAKTMCSIDDSMFRQNPAWHSRPLIYLISCLYVFTFLT
jgi:hypothetical protein